MTTNHQKAQEIYNSNEAARNSYSKMGLTLTGILACTVEQIEAHLELIDEVAQVTGYRLEASRYEVGTDRDTLIAAAQSKVKKNNRSRGYRTLVSKYGEDAAKRIISKNRK